MSKRKLVVGLVVLAALAAIAIPLAQAGLVRCYCAPQARGDYWILQNDPTGAEVRVFVRNPCRLNHNVLVSLFTNALDGTRDKGTETVFVPCHGDRPVDIALAKQFSNVAYIIVTKLGAGTGGL